MHRQIAFTIIASGLCVASISQADQDTCPISEQVPGQYIVRMKQNKSLKNLVKNTFALTNDAHKFNSIYDPASEPRAQLFTFKGESLKLPPVTFVIKNTKSDELKALKKDPAIDTIEPDCRVYHVAKSLQLQAVPVNDPMVNQQWSLEKINVADAWKVTQGSAEVIVSINDSGIDQSHPDLAANLWTNTKEIPNNGIDDDKNGCVDDVHGCDITTMTGKTFSSPNGFYHGTHVGGTVGAITNNSVGVAGIAQKVRLMDVNSFAASGDPFGDTARSVMIKSLYYSAQNGARVINGSWGTQGPATNAEKDSFRYIYDRGVTIVVAAGNESQNSENMFPSGIPTVLAIVATDQKDQIAEFSNWGTVLQLAAPGGRGYKPGTHEMYDPILSTYPVGQGSYGNAIGTSMAAPHVSGVIALMLSYNPTLNPDQIKQILLDTGDPIHVTPPTQPQGFDYKRLNAGRALEMVKSITKITPTPDLPTPSLTPTPPITPPCDPTIENCKAESPQQSSAIESAGAKMGGGCGFSQRAAQVLHQGDDFEIKANVRSIWFLLLALPIALFYYYRRY